MPHSIDLAEHQLVALSRRALATLRAALFRDGGPSAAAYLQEAGYAGGETVYASFRDWLAERGGPVPEELGVEEFQQQASVYFREAGWGTIAVSSLSDAVVAIDSDDWGEADPESHLEHPGCHLTTGMFADFFGRVSDLTLAVLKVECGLETRRSPLPESRASNDYSGRSASRYSGFSTSSPPTNTSRSHGRMIVLSVSRPAKSGSYGPVRKPTAVRTSAAPALTTAATARRSVSPGSQGSSTTSTRLSRTSAGPAAGI